MNVYCKMRTDDTFLSPGRDECFYKSATAAPTAPRRATPIGWVRPEPLEEEVVAAAALEVLTTEAEEREAEVWAVVARLKEKKDVSKQEGFIGRPLTSWGTWRERRQRLLRPKK
jgi:hypothetical protein